jgi:thiol-disulfide isomerase/thioredoxin
VVAGLLLALLAFNLIQIRSGWESLGPLRPGSRAPDFSLPAVDGPPLGLSGQRAPLILLDFWAAWCRPCMKAMPHLASLQRELGPRGLQILSINVEGDPEKSRAAASTLGPAVPVLLDGGEVSQRYRVNVLPYIVIVGRERRVIALLAGPVSEERLRRRLLRELGSAGR